MSRHSTYAATLVLFAAPAAVSQAASASATPDLAPPVSVAQAGPRTSVEVPTIAFASSGRALLTWNYRVGSFGHSGQQAVERRPDGSFGAVRELGSWIEPPLVYKGDRAFALVQKRQQGTRRVRVVFGSTTGRFGAERTIHTGPPEAVRTVTRAAANAHGDIVVAHLTVQPDGARRLVLLKRPAGRRFGRATVVDEHPACVPGVCAGDYLTGGLAVAIGSRGDLVVAWEDGGAVKARVHRAGQRMGPVVRLGKGYETTVHAAVSSRGAAWVAWQSFPADGGTGRGSLTIRLAVRPARARAFRSPRELDRVHPTYVLTGGGHTRLALDPRGAGFVAWSHPVGDTTQVRLASFDREGRRIGARTLSASGTKARLDDLVTSRRPGEALALWTRETVTEEHNASRPMFGLIDTRGAYADERIVSASEQVGSAAASFDPVTGAATIVWPHFVTPAPGMPGRAVLLAAQLGG